MLDASERAKAAKAASKNPQYLADKKHKDFMKKSAKELKETKQLIKNTNKTMKKMKRASGQTVAKHW